MSLARAYGSILAPLVAAAAVPIVTSSNIVLNGLVLMLIVALAGQGWNLLGGYGGQFSFGHSAFFGMGAYASALLQQRLGVNAWIAFGAGCLAGAGVGSVIGFLSFRSGLRGSYFALVTLAFAEVFRIVFNATPMLGGAPGILLKLDSHPANFQFESRAVFYWIALVLVGLATLTMRAIERSRLGAYLAAIRENENAARALGVNVLSVKLKAITLSATFTAAAGAFYVQYFLLINSELAFGTWISIEALLAPIIGGLGTVLGPLVGAFVLHELGEMTRGLFHGIPGADLALFGALLIVIMAFARGGILGALRRLWHGQSERSASATR